MVGAAWLVTKLREMDKRAGDAALPVVRIPIRDWRFAWDSLPQGRADVPALDVGQDRDFRFPTDGPEGLHAHVFSKAGFVDFHLDRADACRDPIAHGVADTHLLGGTAAGAAAGTLIGALLGEGKGAAIGFLAGGATGALIGSQLPRAQRVVVPLDRLLPAGGYG